MVKENVWHAKDLRICTVRVWGEERSLPLNRREDDIPQSRPTERELVGAENGDVTEARSRCQVMKKQCESRFNYSQILYQKGYLGTFEHQIAVQPICPTPIPENDDAV